MNSPQRIINPNSFIHDPVRLFQTFNIFRQVALILGSIILAKSAMGTHDIGQFETLNYLGQFMSIFWVNGLTQAFLALYPKVADGQKKVFINTTFTTFVLIALFCSVILVIGRPILLPFLTESPWIDGFYLFCIYSSINVPSFLIPSILMLEKQTSELRRFILFYFFGYLTVFLLNFLLGGQLINLLVLLNIFAFAIFCIAGFFSFSFNQPFIEGKWLKRLLLIGSPLIGYSIIAGLAPLFDSWLVQRFYEDKAVFAIYRYGAREFPLTVTLAIGLGSAMVASISSNFHTGCAELKKRSRKLYPFVFITSAILIIISSYAFPVVFNQDFTRSAPIFNIYILLIIARMIYPQSVIMGLQKTKILLFISIAELFINIICSLLLGYYFGLVGIAAGTVIAYCAEKVMQILYLKYYKKINLNTYLDILPYSLYSIGLLTVYWLCS